VERFRADPVGTPVVRLGRSAQGFWLGAHAVVVRRSEDRGGGKRNDERERRSTEQKVADTLGARSLSR
jgi:hypothetical protein